MADRLGDLQYGQALKGGDLGAERSREEQLVGGLGVRCAVMTDVARLAALSGQLGYPSGDDELLARLGRFLSLPHDHAIFVAVDETAHVMGWIHVGRRESIETRPRAEILGLVVDSAVRRTGAGRALMSQAEQWAVEHGFDEVILRSNIVRPESHPFYESIGYTRTKTQHVYMKPTAGRASAE